MAILICLNVELRVLIVKLWLTTEWHGGKKEHYSNTWFMFSLFFSLVPISLFPPSASAMPLIALYAALIIECILCRQWVLVPSALWSRIHGTNAGWQPGQFEAPHSKFWRGHICLADWPIYGPLIPELLCTQLTCTHTCMHTHFVDSRTIYSVICKAYITLFAPFTNNQRPDTMTDHF